MLRDVFVCSRLGSWDRAFSMVGTAERETRLGKEALRIFCYGALEVVLKGRCPLKARPFYLG